MNRSVDTKRLRVIGIALLTVLGLGTMLGGTGVVFAESFSWSWEDAERPAEESIVERGGQIAAADVEVAELLEFGGGGLDEEVEGATVTVEDPQPVIIETEEILIEPGLVDMDEPVIEAVPVEEATPAVEESETEWELPEIELVEESEPDPMPVVETAPISSESDSAYNDLLDETLELRKQVAAEARVREEMKQENARLKQQIAGLELRIDSAAAKMEALKQAPVAGPSLDEKVEFEARLERAEQEKAQLAREVEAVFKQLQQARAQRGAPARAPAAAPVVVRPGSDLFTELEQENAELKAEVRRLQEAQMLASRDGQEASDLVGQLSTLREQKDRREKALFLLAKKVAPMKEELDALRKEVAEKKELLRAREKALETLKAEFLRREHRLKTAERMSDLISEAKDDLGEVTKKERRDMYYNMATAYTMEGRHKDAEKSFLQAVSLDPGDADIHYNLGILYEEMDDSRRAIAHYRRYLMLKPDAKDAELVRDWIRTLDM